MADQLHQNPLQTLSQLSRVLGGATQESCPAVDLLTATRQGALLTAAVSGQLQALARSLRPSVLDDFGLVPALHVLVDDFAAASGAVVGFTWRGDGGRIEGDLEAACYRIAQEVLGKIEARGQPAQVVLRLVVVERCLRLVVAAQGVGLNSPPVVETGGLGLDDTDQLVLDLGGSLRIRRFGPSTDLLRLCLRRPIGAGQD
ncbi:MAG: sensor histidine kinase [Candidatus Dormibacteria bacterium]